jgi:carboxyl-terminal processing protease
MFVGAQAPGLTPSKVDELTAKVVVALVERVHMAHPAIDDATAVKWVKTFLRDLDPAKSYFLKADVDEFAGKATTLDDKIKEGDTSFAKVVFDRFLKRLDERLASVNEILDKPMDFSVDESLSDDIDKLEWPKDGAEASDRLRKRIKLQILMAKVAKEPEADVIKKIRVQYKDRKRYYSQFKTDDLLEYYLTALTKTFDPHSSYMSASNYKEFTSQTLHLSLIGIGALLESVDGVPTIKELVPKGPADKDGRIQEEDRILGIQKPDGEEVSFVEKRLNDVVKLIRGEINTKVRLIVQPKGVTEKRIYELTRDRIDLAEEHAKGQIIESKVDGKTLKIGLIKLPAFYGDNMAMMRGDADAVSATKDCRKLLEGFKAQGVNAVMLDLRENGGGLLNEAISLSGLFIKNGPVVQVKDANGVQSYVDPDDETSWDGPFVVVIDHRSASASEIFAGVIKDYGRGLILGGSNTFGKGSVQKIEPINEHFSRSFKLPDLGALKLTIQQFYRANGESTQVRGVAPDIRIPTLFDQFDDEMEAKLDNALAFDKVEPLKHDLYNRVPSDLLAKLDSRSEARRKENEKFRKLDAAIKRFQDRKAKHLISLNEVKYRAEVAAEDQDQDEEGKPKKKAPKRYTDHPAWESSYYNDEIVNIVTDYLTLGSKILAAAPVRIELNNP